MQGGFIRRFTERSGKDKRCLLSTLLSKCDLMHFWSNTIAAGFFPSQNAVANAMANTPQSLDPHSATEHHGIQS